MAIEFRVLGPLEVRRGSALVKISSPKQRLLLRRTPLHPSCSRWADRGQSIMSLPWPTVSK
jgi:hypothetical protein